MRWVAVGSVLFVGVLGLHLPRYLAETSAPLRYFGYPGLVLVAVMIGGTAVVLTPEPLRQAMVLGIFGFALTFLFFTFQAPDVALSEIVVSGIGIPLIVLVALRKIRQQEDAREGDRDEESER